MSSWTLFPPWWIYVARFWWSVHSLYEWLYTACFRKYKHVNMQACIININILDTFHECVHQHAYAVFTNMYTLCPHQQFVNFFQRSVRCHSRVHVCIPAHAMCMCKLACLNGKRLCIMNFESSLTWYNPFMMIVLKSSNDIMQIAWRVLCLCRPSAF